MQGNVGKVVGGSVCFSGILCCICQQTNTHTLVARYCAIVRMWAVKMFSIAPFHC